MKTLVVGATGATGRLIVEDLLGRGQEVVAVVRSPEKLPEHLRSHAGLTIVTGSILELGDGEIAEHLAGCDAVASCLGHSLNFAGLFGNPRRLVRDTARRLCEAAQRKQGNAPGSPVKFVLMNTAGNSNRDLNEPISLGQKCIIGLLRALLPPHSDNEDAADYLRTTFGPENPAIEWVVVRPDSLTNEPDVTPYQLHLSPTRSAIFDPGQTSRINVAHFMAELLTNGEAWETWKGQMPVIYNTEESAE
tara:strand:+ start:1082 stop:1825 length:744 start_codon:yes stop_codon:yes gene_type:complete